MCVFLLKMFFRHLAFVVLGCFGITFAINSTHHRPDRPHMWDSIQLLFVGRGHQSHYCHEFLFSFLFSVFFVIDDVGWTDVGYRNGSEMLTPNLDEMSRSGVILNNYYVQPVCSPSRAALMQGRFPFHTGMQHYLTLSPAGRGHMPLDVPTAAEILEDVGYESYMVGKWHLGYSDFAYTPTKRGFRSHVGYYQVRCIFFAGLPKIVETLC